MTPDQFELFPGKPGSPVYELEGFSAMTPDQQEQVRRYFRVNVAGQEMAASKNAVRGNDSLWNKATVAGDEFVRNYTGGLADYAGAAASYVTEALPGRQPMEGLDFFERRDALRASNDIRAGLIPDWLDNTASLAGVLGLGSGPTVAGARNAGFGAAPVAAQNLPRGISSLKDAVTVGAAVGAGEGLGTSDATTAGGVATDTGVGAAFGAGAGAVADVFMDKVVGGAARRMFGDPNAQTAYAAQMELGIPPSVGSIGNHLAASLENTFATSPTAPFSAVSPGGRSAVLLQQEQRQMLDDALRLNVTDPMRPPGTVPSQTDGDLAQHSRELAKKTSDRLGFEIEDMETRYGQLVPPQTEVNIQRTRDFPTVLRRENTAESIAARADADIAQINKNRMSPVDAQLHGTLMQRLGRAQGQLKQIKNQDSQQAKRLQKTVQNLQRQIYENMGPSWKALRQERSLIGKETERGGLIAGQEKDRLYGTLTQDLYDAAERVRPGAGDEFIAMTSREKDIYADQKILKRYEGGNTSTNFPALRSAVLKGNWEDLDVLLSKATPEEAAVFQADLIDMLGRKSGEPFSAGTFYRNWSDMPDAAKDRVFAGNPEGRAIADTIWEVSKDFTERGKMANHSNTAAATGLMAFLGAAVANPAKLVAFLATTYSIERALVSEAMAKAVAGERTELGNIIRRAVTNYAGTGDQNMEFGPQ